MKKKLFMCDVCNAENAAEIINTDCESSYCQQPVKVTAVERYHCNKCGEDYFDPEQARNYSKRVKAAARQELGLLAPDEIIAIRKKYSLSQERLEWLLSAGAKVVTRWENDRALQPRAVDDLLRLMDRMPVVVEELTRLRKAMKAPSKTIKAAQRKAAAPKKQLAPQPSR